MIAMLALTFNNMKQTLYSVTIGGAIDFDEDLTKPGCVKPIKIAKLPLLLLSNEYNEIKVSENILHHRGIILVNEAQQLCGSVTCPCHAWAYDLNGQLSKNPRIGGAGCA